MTDGIPAPTERAARAATLEKFKPKSQVQSSAWRKKLIANQKGIPKGILANAITALRLAPEWQSVLAFDTFALATHLKHAPPWERSEERRVGKECRAKRAEDE